MEWILLSILEGVLAGFVLLLRMEEGRQMLPKIMSFQNAHSSHLHSRDLRVCIWCRFAFFYRLVGFWGTRGDLLSRLGGMMYSLMG